MTETTSEALRAALDAAPLASVIEAAEPFNGRQMWTIHHYRHGKPEGRSIARGDEIAEWVTDLRASGRLLAGGWELRGTPAPDGWPVEVPDLREETGDSR